MNKKKGLIEITRVFSYGGFNGVQIRTKVINGVVWFVARDVAMALGIAWSGHTLDSVPERWKGVVQLATPGGNQSFKAITEAGLYKLTFRCQVSNEAADQFTDWVAGEVLPTIRKTGKYEVGMQNQPTSIHDQLMPKIAGVEPVFYNGVEWYNYNEVCKALGLYPNRHRKEKMPLHFKVLFRCNFITPIMAKMLSKEAELRDFKEELANSQMIIEFPDDITQG